MEPQKKLISIYKQLKHFQKEIDKEKSWIDPSIVEAYHLMVDELSSVKEEDYSRFKVPESAHFMLNSVAQKYRISPVRTQLSLVIGFLEAELNIDDNIGNSSNGNLVTVINQNTIGINIQQTISQLAEEQEDGEAKEKLSELNNELSKDKKDWAKIKEILKWVLNFSEKLFFAVLPELLKKYNS